MGLQKLFLRSSVIRMKPPTGDKLSAAQRGSDL
jgi:hypothetical protein